jgi:hypothetical protein
MTQIHTQLKTLVQIAVADDILDEKEIGMIMLVGTANRVPKEEIQEIIDAGLSPREKEDRLDYSALSFDDKFEYLYNIVQLMKIDHQVYLTEIKYCESVAEKLGFEKKVISKMSTRIYGDPSITADREKLKNLVKKYIK